MTRRRRWAGDPRSYHDSPGTPSRVIGFNLINTGLPKSPLRACISSRITTGIQVVIDHQINYNCFNEPFAVSPCINLYWDMHGLIFETSIWLLAGSTRFLSSRNLSSCHTYTYITKKLDAGEYRVFVNEKPRRLSVFTSIYINVCNETHTPTDTSNQHSTL